MAKKTAPKERHLPLGLRPSKAIGAAIKALREDKNLTQKEVAEKVGTHFSQISLIENGANVESQWYERLAGAMGFRNALEMLASGGDDLTRKLLRLWKRLPDEEARKDVLKLVQRMIVAELERDAT